MIRVLSGILIIVAALRLLATPIADELRLFCIVLACAGVLTCVWSAKLSIWFLITGIFAGLFTGLSLYLVSPILFWGALVVVGIVIIFVRRIPALGESSDE